MVKIGFFKGHKSIIDYIVNIFTLSKICHCAVITRKTENYICGYSSFPSDGVSYFEEEYNKDEWEFIDVPVTNIELFTFYAKTQDCGYDYCGCINCIIRFHQHKNRYFCSEWCAELLKLEKPEKYTPYKLYALLKKCT